MPTANPEQSIDLSHWEQRADARADDFVSTAAQGSVEHASALLDELLGWKPGQGQPPAEVRAFVQASAQLPAWAASPQAGARLERAQQAFEQREPFAFVVLGFGSLPACYRQPTIADLLAGSGRLGMQVYRRIRETADFVAGVMRPGAFGADGHGSQWCAKVRLVHASMRLLVRQEPPLESAPTGRELQDFLLRQRIGPDDPEPIDQAELAFVLQTFGHLAVESQRALRVRFTAAEAADHLFLWSLVGHLIGVEDELLPIAAPDSDTREEADYLERRARFLFETIRAHQLPRGQAVSDNGQLLAATLVVAMRGAMQRVVPPISKVASWIPAAPARWIDRLVAEVVQSAPRSFVRLFLGRGPATDLGIDRAPLLHYLGHQVAFALTGWVARKSRGASRCPRTRAWTPAAFLRRAAVQALGEDLDGWRALPPPLGAVSGEDAQDPRR